MKEAIITRNPDVMGGTPVFSGTRVPVQTLLDYLEGGESIDDFLAGFPMVSRDQIVAFLEQAKDRRIGQVRVLLDECIDWRLSRDIVGHDVKTAQQMGWATIKNGDLLALAERNFDTFVTVDRNLFYQQNLTSYSIAVIVLRAKSNRLAALRPLVPQLLEALPAARPGTTVLIGQ
jgi:uncharacterized protein (DUF433 family)